MTEDDVGKNIVAQNMAFGSYAAGPKGLLVPLADAFIQTDNWAEAAEMCDITHAEAIALVARFPILGQMIRESKGGGSLVVYKGGMPSKDERLMRINAVVIDPMTSAADKLKAEALITKMVDAPIVQKVEVKHGLLSLYEKMEKVEAKMAEVKLIEATIIDPDDEENIFD